MLITVESPINGDVLKTEIKKVHDVSCMIYTKGMSTLTCGIKRSVDLYNQMYWLAGCYVSRQYLYISMERLVSSWEISRGHARLKYRN